MAERRTKLMGFTATGGATHLIADVDVIDLAGGGAAVEALTLCGMLVPVTLLVEQTHAQVSCERCRRSSAKYSHKTGAL